MAYTFENGAWGTFNDGMSSADLTNKVKRLGFTNIKSFEYPLGTAMLFSRSDTRTTWPYDFLCLLPIGGDITDHRVWVKNLPDLFLFLRETQASRLEDPSEPEDPSQGLVNYLSRTYFDEAMQALYRHLAKAQPSQQGSGIARRVIRRKGRPPNV